jgi:hypothetical protein
MAQQSPPQKGRPPGRVAKTLTLDRAAVALLPALAGDKKAYGDLISALLFAEYARREERAKRLAKEKRR